MTMRFRRESWRPPARFAALLASFAIGIDGTTVGPLIRTLP
jgi:hypothetical protein